MAGRDGENLRMIVQRRLGRKVIETEYALYMRLPEKFAERIAEELDEARGQTDGNVVGLYIGTREPEVAFAPDRKTERRREETLT